MKVLINIYYDEVVWEKDIMYFFKLPVLCRIEIKVYLENKHKLTFCNHGNMIVYRRPFTSLYIP